MPKNLKLNCRKANFNVVGKQLIISSNTTSLKTKSLEEYFPFPEVAIVANLLKKLGFSHTKLTVDNQDHYIFQLEEGVNTLLLLGLITISRLNDLITVKEAGKLYNQFSEASKLKSHCHFFAHNEEESNSTAISRLASFPS